MSCTYISMLPDGSAGFAGASSVPVAVFEEDSSDPVYAKPDEPSD